MDSLDILIAAPIFSVQLLIDGLLIGAIFAMAAYGMALVWGVMNVINIAQGEFVILGGYVTLQVSLYGIHPMFGIPISAVVVGAVGWAVYRIVICRVVDKDLFISILATFGVSILMQQLIDQIWGADIQSVNSGLGTQFLFDDMVTVSEIKVVAFVFVVILGAGLVVFLKRSRLGQAIRATAQNARAARIMGIDTDRVYAATFALNAAICGAAGALVVMTWVIQPFIGLIYTIRSFMIVIVAGLGNLTGVIAAGMGLGVAEQFASFLLGAEFQIGFVFGLLVVILVTRSLLLARKRKYLK
jgi:branched-chain amino acid transport system permease protein